MHPEVTAAQSLIGMTNETAQAEAMDAAYYLDRYGLGPDDLGQVVAFEGHEGTVRDMLDNSACPVGAQIGRRYEAEGFSGVEKSFGGLAALGVNVTISGKTKRFHAGEVSRETLLDTSKAKGADFLE